MLISVVVPAFNEEKKITQVLEELQERANQIIVVDDGSSDQTAQMASRFPQVKVLRHFINRGQGAALQTGIDFALKSGADIIVTFDADGQFRSEEIEMVIQPLLLGQTDVVLGSRFLVESNEVPFSKKIVLKLAIAVTNFYTGLKVTDTHNGFRAFSWKAAKEIEIRQDGMAHASEILEQIKKHQLKFMEVPVTIQYTDYSKQKGQKLSNSFRIILDLILGRISK